MTTRPTSTITQGERFRIGRDEITLHVTSTATRGTLLAAVVRIPAGGGPPALHRHAAEEVYRLDAGELAIYLGDDAGEVRRVVAGPGSVNHIPGGVAHTIRNESDSEATAYVVFSPGGDMESFLRAADALAGDGPPAPEDVMALAARHGIEMAGALPDER